MKVFLRIFFVLLPLFAGVALHAQTNDNDLKFENLVQKAVELFDNSDVKGAAEILAYVVHNEPRNDAAHYYLGMCYFYVRDTDRAVEYLRKAAQLDPKNFWYRSRLSAILNLAGKRSEALAVSEELSKDFPDKIEVLYDLVDMYMAMGRYDQALEAIAKVETQRGVDESIINARYRCLMAQGKDQAGAKVLEDFCSDYVSPQSQVLLGNHYLNEGKDSLALSLYNEALEVAPDYIAAHLGLAEAYRIKANYTKFFPEIKWLVDNEDCPVGAKYDYLNEFLRRSDPRFVNSRRKDVDPLVESMVEQYPADSAVLMMGTIYYYQLQEHGKALDCVKANALTHPDSEPTASLLCEYYAMMGQLDSLADYSWKFHEKFPSNEQFLNTAIYAYYQNKDYERLFDVLREAYDEAAKASDKNKMADMLTTTGDICVDMGYLSKAFKNYKRALKVKPDHNPALNNYAYHLSLLKKQMKKAETMSRKTIVSEPDNPTYLDTFGWILHLQGKDLEAKGMFKHAILYGGKEDPVLLRHYAAVLDALGEKDLAKYYREQAAAKEK
ncbi:MAG: tetratricopeptide repeat protein [Bacteroidales bacterium]|nr:tetratricopeptide repeat protein [Bacteroidales bacterium]